jgi:hypothetical protein
MNLRERFDIKRFWLVLRRDVFVQYRTIVVTVAAAFGVLLIAGLLSAYFGGDGDYHTVGFTLLLFFGGFIFTAHVYHELHKPLEGAAWLLMPASTLEKFLARAVLVSVGMAVGGGVIYFVFALVSEGINQLIFGRGHELFNPVSRDALLAMAHYIVWNAVVLLGAVYFRKNSLIKTVLSLTGLAIVLGLFAGLVVRVVFAPYFTGLVITPEAEAAFTHAFSQVNWSGRILPVARTLAGIGEVIYWAVLAPLCWVVGYLRLRETEVKDAVQ